jgi:hypothetical protein
MAPRKMQQSSGPSLGVQFSAVTRAKLNLLAAGLDRPVGWVIREAVASYLVTNVYELQRYRARFPKLADALDQAIHATGGDFDETDGNDNTGISAVKDDTNSASTQGDAVKADSKSGDLGFTLDDLAPKPRENS